MKTFLVYGVGDKASLKRALEDFAATRALLEKEAHTYGLPASLSDLDDDHKETLQSIRPNMTMQFYEPENIFFRVVVELSDSVPKTTKNFGAICQGGKMCKSAPKKPLHYKGCAVHRIVSDFVAQSGDLTGKGQGESIYGGGFADEKEGLKAKAARGALAMANSGKNSNTSQFFVILTDNPTQLAKIQGKYVIFGKLEAGPAADNLIAKLNEVGSTDGTPLKPVWIEDCGLC